MGKMKDNLLNSHSHDMQDAMRQAFNFGHRYTRSDRSGPGPYTIKPGEDKLVYDEGAVVFVIHQGEEEFYKVGKDYMYNDRAINYRVWSYKEQRWDWRCLNDDDIVASTDVRLATPDEANLVQNLFDSKTDHYASISEGFLLCDGSAIQIPASMKDMFQPGMMVDVGNGIVSISGQINVKGGIDFIPVTVKI